MIISETSKNNITHKTNPAIYLHSNLFHKDSLQIVLCTIDYHQQFQFSVENIENFNDFDETIDISNDFEETIENFNGFEEIIENFQWFGRTQSPLNVFWYADH